MSELIKIVLSLSVSGTLLLLLLWGLKPFYKNKFSRRWQYYIWLIVALRFLLPITLNTTIVGGLFEMFDKSEETIVFPADPNVPVFISNDNGSQTNENIVSAVMSGSFGGYVCAFLIWSALALVLFVRKITIYQSFIRYIKAGNTEVSNTRILNLLSDHMEKLHIKTSVDVFCNPLITSPMLTGFFRPRIILPARELDDTELSYIFVHELTHYKQRDMFYKWLIQVVVCAHWFNPFIYLLEKEVNISGELSCDEKVISGLDDTARRAYGDTLIAFLKPNNFYKNALASVTLTEGAEQLKERLGAIMKFKKTPKNIVAITAIFTFIVCVCFLISGAYATPSVANDTEKFAETITTQPEYITISQEKKNDTENSAETIMAQPEYITISQEKKNDTENSAETIMAQPEYITISQEPVIKTVNHTFVSTYTQNGYYCEPYIIEMGWNLSESAGEYYNSPIELTLEDGSKIPVCFSDRVKPYRKDKEAAAAIGKLIYSLKNKAVNPSIEKPVIMSITPVAVDEIPALAEKYFQEDDLIRFSALFPVLDKAVRKEYCQRAFDADKITFFSNMALNMDKEEKQKWLAKTKTDRKTNFAKVLELLYD